MMSEVKLPKQWRHWCADQKLRIHGTKRGQGVWQWFYLRGKGFYWRVNCYGMLQRGDAYADFDRWSMCRTYEVPLPQTRAEFRDAIARLISADASSDPGDAQRAFS